MNRILFLLFKVLHHFFSFFLTLYEKGKKYSRLFFQPIKRFFSRFSFPVIVRLYTYAILFHQRWKLFSHSSHRILSVMTHRITVAFGIAVISVSIISMNVVLATQPEKGARQFAKGALVDQVIFQENDIIVTNEELRDQSTGWLQDGSSIQDVPTSQGEKNPRSRVVVTEVSGIALAAPTAITQTARTRTTIEEYIVQDGDTAGTIAQKFNLRIQTILDANKIKDENLIRPGQTLLILPIDGISYTFKKKDTLKKLAKTYNADIQDILDFNKLESEESITVGQVLILPDGRIPPPPPPKPVVEQTPTVVPETQIGTTAITTTESTQTATTTTETSFEAPTQPAEPTVPQEQEVSVEQITGGTASAATGSLAWPTTTSRISQQYGYGHTGLDIDGEFGDPIYAADNGTVVSAGWAGPYGNFIVVDHGNGIVTRYAHLQAMYVGSGQVVSKGSTIGEQGSTGNSTGSHLHYEVMVNGQFVNPYSY